MPATPPWMLQGVDIIYSLQDLGKKIRCCPRCHPVAAQRDFICNWWLPVYLYGRIKSGGCCGGCIGCRCPCQASTDTVRQFVHFHNGGPRSSASNWRNSMASPRQLSDSDSLLCLEATRNRKFTNPLILDIASHADGCSSGGSNFALEGRQSTSDWLVMRQPTHRQRQRRVLTATNSTVSYADFYAYGYVWSEWHAL